MDRASQKKSCLEGKEAEENQRNETPKSIQSQEGVKIILDTLFSRFEALLDSKVSHIENKLDKLATNEYIHCCRIS